jgi:cell division protein ZapA (FtsZ GTPase activity inhibitor)
MEQTQENNLFNNFEKNKKTVLFPKSLPKRTVNLKICEQELKLVTDKTEDELKQIVNFIESTVSEIIKKNSAISPQKSYILAALIIAEKYFTVLKLQEHFKQTIAQKAESVEKLLDEFLKTE